MIDLQTIFSLPHAVLHLMADVVAFEAKGPALIVAHLRKEKDVMIVFCLVTNHHL